MVIAEFPTIRIDNFKLTQNGPPAELCFLTHMHEDHTGGLSRKSYYGPIIYCTSATRALLLNYRSRSGLGDLKYNHLRREYCGKELVKALELDKQYQFDLKDGSTIQVTLIDANHCPGAAMILIQPSSNHGRAVLYTGDVRCEKWHLDNLTHNPALFSYMPKLGGTKSLGLYVDDTFLQHVNPFKTYVPNYVGIQSLTDLLLQYPPEVHFCLADQVTGYEEILISLAQSLDSLIHMDAYFYNIYHLASDSSMLARKLLDYCTLSLEPLTSSQADSEERDKAGKSVRIHFCQKNMSCPMREPHAPMAYFKPCNQPIQKVVDIQNSQHHSTNVPPGIMEPIDGSQQVFKGPDQRYYLDSVSNKFFPLFPWFYFSRHASYPEVCNLRDLFNVRYVRGLTGQPIPCASPKPKDSPPPREVGDSLRTPEPADQVGDSEPAPQVARVIPNYMDRQKLQERRKAMLARQLASDASTLESQDEEACHRAMMLLCQNSNAPKQARPNDNEVNSPFKNGYVQETYDEETHYRFAPTANDIYGASSLPSPPYSPSVHYDACDFEIGASVSVIEETLEDIHAATMTRLTQTLRADPDSWFDLKIECLQRNV